MFIKERKDEKGKGGRKRDGKQRRRMREKESECKWDRKTTETRRCDNLNIKWWIMIEGKWEDDRWMKKG